MRGLLQCPRERQWRLRWQWGQSEPIGFASRSGVEYERKEAGVIQGLWPVGFSWTTRFLVTSLHPPSLGF